MPENNGGNGGTRATRVTPDIVVSDPSSLTTDQLLREVAHIREWVETYVDGEVRLIAKEFEGVTARFQIAESQRVEQKADTKEAVETALSSAKEAVKEQTKASAEAIGKTETLTKQQLEQQATQFKDGLSALGEKLDEVKTRVTQMEQAVLTTREGARAARETKGVSMGLFSVAISGVVALVVVLTFVMALAGR